jgi:hypothetical protein
VLVVLTADHGVAELPETAPAGKMPGGRLQDADLGAAAEAALERKFGAGKWVTSVLDGAVYLDPALIEKKRVSAADVQNAAADALLNLPHVFRVYTREELRHGLIPQDNVSRMVSRSLNWSRSGDLQVILEPHWVRPARNTGHDTPCAYDTHNPLIFLRAGVKPGQYFQNVELNDLAPTLASLLSVQSPSGSVGRVLYEVIAPPPAARPVSRQAAKR